MTTVEILRKARDHIAQPGMWIQGRFFAAHVLPSNKRISKGPCCALGALLWAGESEIFSEAETVQLLEAVTGDALSTWNDAPGRTQAEVVALFDRAIELAEREPTP